MIYLVQEAENAANKVVFKVSNGNSKTKLTILRGCYLKVNNKDSTTTSLKIDFLSLLLFATGVLPKWAARMASIDGRMLLETLNVFIT